MAQTVTYVDSIQTRIFQSFVNLTKLNSTIYPAVTTVSLGYNDTTTGVATTAYQIYDQWALRTISSPLTA
jgi:hypothetical protein